MRSEFPNVLYSHEFHAHTMTTLRPDPSTFLEPAVANTSATALEICLLRRWLVALAAVLAALTFPVHATECSANPGGNPNQPGQCAGAGNPINVMTGNKYQREEDMPALPGVLGLEIVRHYNSAFSSPGHPSGPLGRGWRLSYETEVIARWGKIQVLLADGGRVIFDRDARNPTGCTTTDPANGSMVVGRQQDGQSDYTWTWADGRKLHFNVAGKLDRIAAPTGEIVRLLYDSQNVLVRVIDPQGRSLNLVYYDRHVPNQFHGVQFIDSPVGRFAYEYGITVPKGAGLVDQRQLLAHLVRVRLPDQFDPDTKAHALSSRGTTLSTTSRFYHHEDPRSPWLMTGISIEAVGEHGKPASTRYATYGYDDTGRAILSTHAGNVGKVTLDNEAGKTVLTNSLGQKTVYRYTVIAGEYRLVEVRGAGCALCGEPNVRHGYDDAGRIIETTKLFENGEPFTTTKVERDKLGRVRQVGKIVYHRGKPGLAQLQVRFEYQGTRFAPTLVARPSVVPGKELVTRIDYNEAGQPLSVAETGWAPTADGKHAAEQIERTVRYRYATINGRSLLTEIDGPLPNGKRNSPLDSDITVIEYDRYSSKVAGPKASPGGEGLAQYVFSERREGILTAIITPGNRRSEFDYDYAGRIATVKDAEGHTSSLRYSPRGQLLTVRRDGVTHNMRYDSLGHPTESGYGDATQYRAQTRYGYDDAGRNVWTASALGIMATRRFDTEGQLLESAMLSNTIKRAQRYEYDQLGRLRAVTDSSGRSQRIGWNALGLPDELTDAMGRSMRFGYDDSGNVTAVTEQDGAETRFELDVYGSPTAVAAPNGATTRYVRDDFGRVLATIATDSGTTIRRFDAAGQLIASLDANGNLASYEYDVMGRILLQRVTDVGNGGRTTVTTWRYEGPRLIAIDHPNQAEHYDYDEQGRVSAKTVILKLTGGARASTTTRYRYDAMDTLAGVSLPDGSMLEYRRNGQNQITALERSPACTRWLCWLLPRQTIVQNLERDVVGLKRLTYGNGIEAYYLRSREGSLARIVYRDPRMLVPREQGGGALEALLGVGPALATQPVAVDVERSTLPGALGLPPDPQALLDHRYLWDVQGNLLHTRDKDATNSYAYDAHDRLIAAATGPVASFARYHYDTNGNRLLAQEGLANQSDIRGNTVKTSYAPNADHWQTHTGGRGLEEAHYDADGQPERIGHRSFVWDATGKLLEVRDGSRVLARYRYNHRGERIEKTAGGEHTYYLYEDRKIVAELDGKGRLRRQYIYLAGKPVAIIDATIDVTNGPNDTAPRGFMAAIAALWRTWFGESETIVYLHSNHLGATEMATDIRGKPIWQATYSPFGKLMPTVAQRKTTADASAFELNLRLPGQYADKETGLYYNDHRYYDPVRGRYLTPDPLGLDGGSNGYAYVSNNPLKYIDPQGLVLFAFDGTNNSNPPPGKDDFSNVYKFFLAYDTSQNGPAWYMNGIGRDDPDSGIKSNLTDVANANTGHERVRFMQKRLDDYMSKTTFQKGAVVNIDIVGFSRGAAMARDFANRVASRLKTDKYKDSGACVQIRFLGLWDTVAQFGVNGADNTEWQLAIPAEAKNVFHAVALNEHRYAFPGEAIGSGIQRGFIGSHADIGGSYGTGDLSDVALNWIVEQAKATGIKMFNWGENGTNVQWGIVTNPLLHDKGGSDRDFCLRSNHEMWADNCQKQKQATPGGMTWSQTQTGHLISLYPKPTMDADGSSAIVGIINMREYAAWLKQHYGLEVQFSSP
jgi:RHS repeat-associated protein